MSTKIKNKFWLMAVIPALAIQLFGAKAWAVDAKAGWYPRAWVEAAKESVVGTETLPNSDLTPEEMGRYFPGFGVRVSGKQVTANTFSNSTPSISVDGFIFQDCARTLSIKIQRIENDNGTVTPAIQVTDPQGEARICQQKMNDLKYKCDGQYTCIPLQSKLVGTNDLSGMDGGEVIAFVQGNLTSFNPPITFKNGIERITESEKKRQAEARRLHAPEIDRLQAILTDCPSTPDGVTRQRRALEKLSRIEGVLDSGEWNEIKREIDKNELKVLSDLARTVPIDELADIQRRLVEVERLDNNVAASVYVQIAESYARSTEKHSLRQAVSAIKQARTMGNLTEHNRVQLDNLFFDYRIKELREYAGNGTLSVGLYQREISKLSSDLEKRRQDVCGRGIRANGEACSGVTAQIEDLRQVPQDAQQGWQNRMQLQMYRGPSSVNSSSMMFGRVFWW